MIELRAFTHADQEQVLLMDAISFATAFTPEEADFVLREVRERMLVAEQDGLPVGVTSSLDSTISLPGGAVIAAPGITWVSVRPTHRRQGVLSAMMHAQLDEFRDCGAPATVLTASEAGIYGRYGFGAATRQRTVRIDRRRTRLREPADRSGVLVATTEQAREVLPAIYEANRARVPGMLSRSELWWQNYFEDPPITRGGLSPRLFLIHSEGYLCLRGKEGSADGNVTNTAVVVDYQPGTPTAHAALWSVLLDLDLYEWIDVRWFAADDPLPGLITDPRQVRAVSDQDGMWLRPLNPAALLGARSYALDIDVVIGVRDPRYGDLTLRLAGGPDGADCRPVADEPQIILDVGTLGAVSLGGVRLQHCHGVDGDPASIRLLDRALLGDHVPNHCTPF